LVRRKNLNHSDVIFARPGENHIHKEGSTLRPFVLSEVEGQAKDAFMPLASNL